VTARAPRIIGMTLYWSIHWGDKLRRLMLTLAFCLAIAAVQSIFEPEKAYDVSLRYSLLIGVLSWIFIDFGRHFFPSARETGWPQGLGGPLLPMIGIALAYLIGTLLGDAWTGLSTWGASSGARMRVSIGITLLAGIACTYYFYSKARGSWLENRMVEARGQASEARLKLLQTQLEPHMLFNTLANLRVLIGTDPARAQEMLDRIIAYLRATLDASRQVSHSLEAEFERLRDYLALMAVRMGPRLSYALDLPGEHAQTPVPTLLLQPLVENAIQHGLEPKIEGGHIRVSARHEQGQLLLEVADTGLGMADASTPTDDGNGFGLAQVRERLATAYGDAASIEVVPAEPTGTRVTIRLPAQDTLAK